MNDDIYKFDRGLQQLGRAERDVGVLRVKLEKLIPELKQKAEESAIAQKQIETEKKEVDK